MIHDARRAKEAAEMALSNDLRKRVVEAVTDGGMSRNAAAKRFGVSIASAVRWLHRFAATGEISPAPTGGDRRSDRIEAHRDYLLGLIRRQPDMMGWTAPRTASSVPRWSSLKAPSKGGRP
jgi:transposase